VARLLYSVAWYCALPFVLCSLVWRARRQPGYLHYLGERVGFAGTAVEAPRPPGGRLSSAEPAGRAGSRAAGLQRPIWIHAVSVGETRAAQSLIRALADRYPDCSILLTHMTPTGRETGAAVFADLIAQGRLQQCWLPYDTPSAMRRFLRGHQPRLGLLMETELWPNLVAAARSCSVPLVLVNARLSEKSLRKGLRWRSLIMPAVSGLTQVLAQTGSDAERLARLGRSGVPVLGNLKFDIEPPSELIGRGRGWRDQVNGTASTRRGIVLAASTREGEEALILDAWQAAPRDGAPLLVLVPRHPQRFDEVAALVTARGLTCIRRSAGTSDALPSTVDADVMLGDSMGEMFAYYSMADVAIMGGSLQPLGGQNLIEACVAGTPVVVGPHMFNFDQVTADALDAGAVLQVSDAKTAVAEALHVLRDDSKRLRMSECGRAFAAQHRGATERTMQALRPML
jgi:3-deoxy-D-manno-octulosonic-acid transferase